MANFSAEVSVLEIRHRNRLSLFVTEKIVIGVTWRQNRKQLGDLATVNITLTIRQWLILLRRKREFVQPFVT